MNLKHCAIAAAWLLALAAHAVDAAPQARWTIVPIPPLALQGSANALDINNRGQVVGYTTVNVTDPIPQTSIHGFLWDNGTMIDLGRIASISPFSVARSINDAGTIAGGNGMGNNYLWKDGTWSLIFSGSVNANLINKFEMTAGTYSPDNVTLHGYTYRDGVFVDVGTLGGRYSEVDAINDKGVAVGKSSLSDNSTYHPFLYQDGVLKDLGTFGGGFGVALGINNHGVVVGSATDAANVAHAFIYDGTNLRQLIPRSANSTAVAINDHGTVIGWLAGGAPYVYEDGVVTMLLDIPEVRTAGWTSMVPTSINDRGWITGYGRKRGAPGDVSFVLAPKSTI